jgi:hypothetical protein
MSDQNRRRTSLPEGEWAIGIDAKIGFEKVGHKCVVSGHLVAEKTDYALWLQKPLRRYIARTCRHVVACERRITDREGSNKWIPPLAHPGLCS